MLNGRTHERELFHDTSSTGVRRAHRGAEGSAPTCQWHHGEEAGLRMGAGGRDECGGWSEAPAWHAMRAWRHLSPAAVSNESQQCCRLSVPNLPRLGRSALQAW